MSYCNFFILHGSFLPALTGSWCFMCSDTETGCFYLERQNHLFSLQTCPGHKQLKVSWVWSIPCSMLPFPVFCCWFWLVLPLYRVGFFSPLEFVSPASLEPVPAEQGFSSFSQCKELNHPMSSEKPSCWQGKPSDLLESVNEIREQASINLVNRCIDLNSLESMFNTSGWCFIASILLAL